MADDGLWLISGKRPFGSPEQLGRHDASAGCHERRGQAGRRRGRPCATRPEPSPLVRQSRLPRARRRCALNDLRPALWRGGHLIDPTTVTDYDLFVYEADATRAAAGARSRCPYLIRVDATGARTVPWETPRQPRSRRRHWRRRRIQRRATQAASQARAGARGETSTRRQPGARGVADGCAQPTEPSAERPHRRHRRRRPSQGRPQAHRGGGRTSASPSSRRRSRSCPGHSSGSAGRTCRRAALRSSRPRRTASRSRCSTSPTCSSSEGWQVADVHAEGKGFDLHARKGREPALRRGQGRLGQRQQPGHRPDRERAREGRPPRRRLLALRRRPLQRRHGTLYARLPEPGAVFADAAKDKAILHINGSALEGSQGEPRAHDAHDRTLVPVRRGQREQRAAAGARGNSEKALFTWFAERPLAQAKAAVICSLLPWPDEPGEQHASRIWCGVP